jgi:cytochrome c oxidase assembly protein subunit 15
MKQQAIKGRSFRRFSAVTVIAVYLLILIGGIVRSTGSGMGCPDWPKCFGSWVPPTDVSQLPIDYKEDYTQQRVEKNKKIVSYLTAFGFDDLAYQIENDPNILIEEDFNVVKTWIEYVNRLIGAVIGFLIFGTFILSLIYWKTDRTITVLSFLAFILVGFQGWIGSIVVSTNLLHWMITIHMLFALVIVCLLIYVYYRSKRSSLKISLGHPKRIYSLLVLCVALTTIQVVLGTQVREAIDVVSENLARASWIENLGIEFKIHRSYSILLLVLHVFIVQKLVVRSKEETILKNPVRFLFAIVVIEILTGVIMAYFGVPAAVQPIHLLLGTLIVGVQYYVLLLIGNKNLKSNTAE